MTDSCFYDSVDISASTAIINSINGYVSAYQCQNKCQSVSDCNFFTYYTSSSQSVCELKSSTDGLIVRKTGYISGPKFCSRMIGEIMLQCLKTIYSIIGKLRKTKSLVGKNGVQITYYVQNTAFVVKKTF